MPDSVLHPAPVRTTRRFDLEMKSHSGKKGNARAAPHPSPLPAERGEGIGDAAGEGQGEGRLSRKTYGLNAFSIFGPVAMSTRASISTLAPRCRSSMGIFSSVSCPGYGFPGNHIPNAIAFGSRFA